MRQQLGPKRYRKAFFFCRFVIGTRLPVGKSLTDTKRREEKKKKQARRHSRTNAYDS